MRTKIFEINSRGKEKMNTKLFCACLLTVFTGTVFSDNFVFNGSFELGTDGFALWKYMRPDTNPKLEFIPLTVGEGAPGCGKNSLRLDNRYTEHFDIFSKEFRLKPDTTYRASAKMRSSQANTSLWFMIFKVDSSWFIRGKKVSLQKDWQEFSFTFTTKKKNGNGYFHFDFHTRSDKELVPGDIFIDDLRVTEEGKPAPDPQVHAVVVPDRNLYQNGEKADMTLKLFNSTGEIFDGPVKIAVTDEFTKKLFFETDLPVKLEPGEMRKFPLAPLALTRFGGFRITVSGKGLKTHDGFFSVIGKYEAKPFDVNSDFVVAVDAPTRFYVRSQNEKTKFPYHQVLNAPLERRYEIFKQAGIRLMRDYGGGFKWVDWCVVQPSKEKFDFTALDLIMDLYKKYDITYFPVIGNVNYGGNIMWGAPKWANMRKILDDSPYCPPSVRGKNYMPDDKEYHTYIYETVKHLKGRVPVYEITNEPIFNISSENYVHELKIAHDAIRKADPDAKICGLSLSSDFGTDSSQWLIQCLKLGVLQYCDFIGYHPYWSPQLGSYNPADKDIATLRENVKRYGKKDMLIWNTELYYIYDGAKEWTVTPNYAVSRFLIDLAEGLVQSISLNGSSLWKTMLTPNRRGSCWQEYIPSENLVALNTMARLFERAKPVGKYRYDDMVICYVYRDRNKKLIAAIWNYLDRAELSIDLSAFQVMDLFGNPEKAEVKPLQKVVPYFLTQGKMSEQDFLEKIRNLKPILGQPVASGELGRLAGDTLFVMLHNFAVKPVEVTLGLNGKGLVARKLVKQEVPANGKIAVEIPVKVKDPDVKDAVLVIQTNGNLFRQKIEIVRNPMIKGTFEGKNFKGDLSFGNGKIRVKLTVQDATDAGVTGKRDAWQTDCVELFFDTDPLNIPERHAKRYTKNVFRIFITPRDGKLTTMGFDPAKCVYSAKCGKDSYTAELEIPAETGDFLGFECKIDDYDAAGKKLGESQIGSGERLHMRRTSFGLARKE